MTGFPRALSAIIPTYQRPEKLAACLGSLARQSIDPDRYEVLVGLDGRDDATATAARSAWIAAGGREDSLVIVECPRLGLNATRNALLPKCRGEILLSLNDDILADADLIAQHIESHAQARSLGLPGACITGAADWIEPSAALDTLMDRLVRETSMVFFYDQMREARSQPWSMKDWGFRHCWGLNFSVPTRAIRSVGGFTAFPLTYGHDDIELAYRLDKHFNFPVLYRPLARVRHDHRYRAPDILAREHNLGVASYRFADAFPDFGLALFGRDVTSESEIAYSREFLQREHAAAERLRETFLALDHVPARAVPDCQTPEGATIIAAVYQQHLLLKRYVWRQGLLAAADEAAAQRRAGDSTEAPAPAVPASSAGPAIRSA